MRGLLLLLLTQAIPGGLAVAPQGLLQVAADDVGIGCVVRRQPLLLSHACIHCPRGVVEPAGVGGGACGQGGGAAKGS